MRDAHHPVELGADGRSLRVRNLSTQRGEWWEVPLGAAPAPAPPDPT